MNNEYNKNKNNMEEEYKLIYHAKHDDMLEVWVAVLKGQPQKMLMKQQRTVKLWCSSRKTTL